MIFWTATPKLWVVSSTIFSPRPLYKAKSWKTQNTVFGYKKWLKFESDRIFWSTTPILWVVSFTTFSRNDFWNKLGFPCFAALFGAIFCGKYTEIKNRENTVLGYKKEWKYLKYNPEWHRTHFQWFFLNIAQKNMNIF